MSRDALTGANLASPGLGFAALCSASAVARVRRMTALLRLLVVLEPHRGALSRAAGVMLSRQRLAVAFLSLCISTVFKVFVAETPFQVDPVSDAARPVAICTVIRAALTCRAQVWLMRWTMIMVASIFWTLAAAQFAFLGMQDPEKRSLASPPAPKGPPPRPHTLGTIVPLRCCCRPITRYHRDAAALCRYRDPHSVTHE